MQPCTLDTRYWSLLYILFLRVYLEDKQLEWNERCIVMEIRKAENDGNDNYFYPQITHRWAWFWNLDRLKNQTEERFKIFEVRPRSNQGRTLMMS